MENLIFFPTLSEDLFDNSGCSVDKYFFSYSYQGEVYGLKSKGISTIKLTDPLEIWKVETEGLILKKTVRVAYQDLLFGKNGIACTGAEIGICIIWTNNKLTQTGYILPEEDISTPNGRTCRFSHEFQSGELSGDLELSLIMYIKKASESVPSDEASLMNEEGVAIGELETVVVDFSNAYMEFPIEEYKSENEPLWWIEFSQWDDPKVDRFDKENICLYLNPYYQGCPMVGETIKNVDMLIDVLAQSYLLIFNKIGENEDDLRATKNNTNLEVNSICSIMHQFIESCSDELHFESSEKLLKSLHKNLRKMLKEGEEE